MSDSAVTACVLIIGNEILSGRTQDANLSFIARTLNEHGIQVREARTIPDVEAVIVETLNAVRSRFDYVFTTGGIGPTHDDITADCVARAFGVPLVMHPQIEGRIRAYAAERGMSEEITRASLRMARVPEGGELVETEVGAPGFSIGNVYVMAGIPAVMQSMLGLLAPKLRGARPVRARSVGAYLGESQVADRLRAIQDAHPAVDIGSYPFSDAGRYGTTLVVRGTDEALLDTVLDELRTLITTCGAEPLERS
ncbi:MAG: molybdopterin-binding protein [Pseudomonadales bacterium]|jgi:molybdenum cofactor synthesis domain-containing protein|nr:molybdopterin-binding protein [Pseudomonadales bacterium]